MQFKQIVLVAVALIPFASSVAGAPAPVAVVVGEDGLVKRQCVIEFRYTYCGAKEEEDEAAKTTSDAVIEDA